MKRFMLSVSALLVLLISCGDNAAEEDSIDIENAIEQAASRRSADPHASGANTCLLSYQEKYDALLPADLVLQATGFDKAVLTTDYTRVMKPEHHAFAYKFKNGRIGMIKALNREMELTDIVSVHSIKAMSPDQFTKSYRAISAEEMQAAKEAAKELTGGKNAEQQETVRQGSNTLLNTFKEISEGYEAVAGLGDMAVWNKVTNDLAVLQNGVKFELKAEVSNDTEKNKALAVSLAKTIVSKCP